MNSLAIGDKLQAIKEIAIGGCEDIEVSEKIFDLCDEILGLVNSASCNCQHNSNSRENEPCCRCDSRKENANMVKVNSLEIIVRMIDSKPYYELKYRQVGKKDYSIGYSSYDLKTVLGYINTFFEIAESEKQTHADKIRNMSDEELAEFLDIVGEDGISSQYADVPCDCCCEKTECSKCWKDWLKSEAK